MGETGETYENRLEGLAERCAGDGEFMLLARHWTGTLRLCIGNDCIDLRMRDGVPVAEVAVVAAGPLPDEQGLIGLSATHDLWERMLAPVPQPFYNDVVPAQALGLQRSGSELTFWQYYPAVRRVVELLRPSPAPVSSRST